jgi:hypothetical protein
MSKSNERFGVFGTLGDRLFKKIVGLESFFGVGDDGSWCGERIF